MSYFTVSKITKISKKYSKIASLILIVRSAWNQELRKYKEKKKCLSGNEDLKLIKPSLLKAIIKTFWLRYFVVCIIMLIEVAILRIMVPIFQSFIIEYFDMNNETSVSQNEALIYVTELVLVTFAITFLMHHTGVTKQLIGMRVVIACSSLIYRKSLKLSKASLNKMGSGQVINLLSNDVMRLNMVSTYFNVLWTAPIQIIVIGYVIWQSIKVYTLVAIGSLIIMTLPIQIYLSKVSGKLRGLIAKLSDRRVQLMNELIAGIQVIKMYAWEKSFDKIVSETREMELKQINYSLNLKSYFLSLYVISGKISLFLTIVSIIFTGNSVTASIVFQLASYFNMLQLSVGILLPIAIIVTKEALISIKRMENFLMLDEMSKYAKETKKCIQNEKIHQVKSNNDYSTTKQTGSVQIEFQRVSVNWVAEQLPPTLNDISLKIKDGELCSLVGAVGSGKSSLLKLLLQELPVGSGVVGLCRDTKEQNIDLQSRQGFCQDNSGIKISYASQDPWLFTGTVRENILFGQEFDGIRYQEVTKVCSLLRDFKQFPNNDLTIVGERGASLSGGQKARINLARAIYRQADVYLLDDPLSAVDARVARRLFKDCIVGYLQGKTRILATHQIHYLRQADNTVILDRGIIRAQGSFEMLTETSADFNDMLNRLKNDKKESDMNKCDDGMNAEVNEYDEKKHADENHYVRTDSTTFFKSINNYQLGANDQSSKVQADPQDQSEPEMMAKGVLSVKIYSDYFLAGSSTITLTCFVLIYILSQVILSGADYWLSYWINLESMKTCINEYEINCKFTMNEYELLIMGPLFTLRSLLDENGFLQTNYAIYIYTACVVAFIILVVWRNLFCIQICMKASRKLHDRMLFNIIQATSYFFSVNPSGRILNRFSRDIGAADEFLPSGLVELIQRLSTIFGIIILIIIVNQWMIIPFLVVIIVIYFSCNYYFRTVQDLKRLEGIAKSPILSHITATLNGLTTIRSRGQDIEALMQKKFDKLQDNHTAAWFLVINTTVAFGLAVDLISSCFICCLCYSLVLLGPEYLSGAAVGLVISQSLVLTLIFQFGVKQITEVQSQMTSIERIIQYTDLPKEDFNNLYPTDKNWPSKGQIEYKNVFLSYRKDDPAVLKDINLIIKPGWKVGVVGRTGAGKSSLITALFRLVNDGILGEIIIDDKDTKEINLQDLRSSISIIPQEPVLFSETLRYNLDPFDKYTDDAIWDALKEVELSDMILDQWITEGGTNFSVGQRQLICFARALLRNIKILVLDEATANVDSRTDTLIQRLVRSKFTDCTVITIAHRLNTIIDSDRVLVMDNGRVVEFDSPYELIFKKQNSLFNKMIEQTGIKVAEKLRKEAELCHRQDNIHT